MAAGRDSRSWKFLSSCGHRWWWKTPRLQGICLFLQQNNKKKLSHFWVEKNAETNPSVGGFQKFPTDGLWVEVTYIKIVETTDVTEKKNTCHQLCSERSLLDDEYLYLQQSVVSLMLFGGFIMMLEGWDGETWELKDLQILLWAQLPSPPGFRKIFLQQNSIPYKAKCRVPQPLYQIWQSVTLRSHGVFRRFFILQDRRNRLHLSTEPLFAPSAVKKKDWKTGKGSVVSFSPLLEVLLQVLLFV